MTLQDALHGSPEDRRTYIEAKIAVSLELIQTACGMFPPKSLIGLMSGGNDSVPACYVASLHPRFTGMLHVNTETGIEETHEHVRTLCASRRWELFERRPSNHVNGRGAYDPIRFRDWVLANGFPGPAQHGTMYQKLKQRQLECFEREMEFKPKDGEFVIYVSGVRHSESKRRKETTHIDNTIKREGRRVWCAAIWDWDKADCLLARQYAGLPPNPVSEKIGMSGECLCGAYAHKPELENLRKHYPEKAAEIDALTAEVRAAGFPWDWDEEPPKWFLDARRDTHYEMEMELAPPKDAQHLCVSCNTHPKAIQDGLFD